MTKEEQEEIIKNNMKIIKNNMGIIKNNMRTACFFGVACIILDVTAACYLVFVL